MKLAVDVHYAEGRATIAGILFAEWSDGNSIGELIAHRQIPADYLPGWFYKRELPCILQLIEENGLEPEVIIIDGYVYLDGCSRAGMGKHLYDAYEGRVPVIGVAKNRFRGIGTAYAVMRGTSCRPLFVTAAGIDLERAKENIRNMHGSHRLPTLLKRVDRLCRDSSRRSGNISVCSHS